MSAADDDRLVDGQRIEDVLRQDREARRRQEQEAEDRLLDEFTATHFPGTPSEAGTDHRRRPEADGDDARLDAFAAQMRR